MAQSAVEVVAAGFVPNFGGDASVRLAAASTRWPRPVMVVAPERMLAPSSSADFLHVGVDVQVYSSAAGALIGVGAHDLAAVVVPADLIEMEVAEFVAAVAAWTSAPVLIGIDGSESGGAAAFRAMDAGARAMIPMPFGPAALSNALRSVGLIESRAADGLTFGRIRLDLLAHRLMVDGREVSIANQEFLLLEYLLRAAPRLVPFSELLDAASGYDGTSSSAVRTQVAKIRRKIAAIVGGESPIETVYGRGYRLRG